MGWHLGRVQDHRFAAFRVSLRYTLPEDQICLPFCLWSIKTECWKRDF
jgi:hypothetical protein